MECPLSPNPEPLQGGHWEEVPGKDPLRPSGAWRDKADTAAVGKWDREEEDSMQSITGEERGSFESSGFSYSPVLLG